MSRHNPSLAIVPAALALASIACAVDLGLPAGQDLPQPTYTAYPTLTPYPTNPPAPTQRATRRSTPRPTATRKPSCISPGDVTVADEGKLVEVCGTIVDEGEVECDACAYGYYSYLTFNGGFTIISYYWDFSSYEGACLMASDRVELLGGHPIFVYGTAEGYAGSACVRGAGDSITCDSGEYFRSYDGCQ
jgi:hypothetical protein